MSPRDEGRPARRGRRVLDRVVALRRATGTGADRGSEPPAPTEIVQRLQQRVEHLEHQLQGLQDSIHRESRRRDEEMKALQRKLQPGEMARSLSDDARRRGL
jgi:uncharacterized protein YlxW (UPF0749 family)